MGRSSRPLDKGGGEGLQKKFLQPFEPQFGLKIGGGGRPSPDRHYHVKVLAKRTHSNGHTMGFCPLIQKSRLQTK